MTYPFYPLYYKQIDKRWTLKIYVDQQGNIIIGMVWTFGTLNLNTFKIDNMPTKIPNKALSEINRILREVKK